MPAFGHKQIKQFYELKECRMSNKEFRMTKFSDFNCHLRTSLFVIRPARNALKKI
jgi:hypothetical protein